MIGKTVSHYRIIEKLGGEAIDSIAVLPFVNLGGDPETAYLGDGISDDIANTLSKYTELQVFAGASVRTFRGKELDLREVASKLGAGSVLEGNLRTGSSRIHVAVKLYRAPDGRLLWGDQYDRGLADIQGVQEEIIRGIVEKLRLNLSSDQRKLLTKRYTENTEAYQLYLKGRQYWDKKTLAAFYDGIKCFEQAIKIDPTYALAYAGAADSYWALGIWGLLPPQQTYPQAKQWALKAIQLDDGLAEAHNSLATVAFLYEWNWQETEREFKRAIQLNPRYSTVHSLYGTYLAAMKRFDEAIDQYKQAQKLDPLIPILNTNLGIPFYYSGRYDDAVALYTKAVEFEPGFAPAHASLGWAYVWKQRYEEAIARFEEGLRLGGRTPSMISNLCFAYGFAGKKGEALKLLEELKEIEKKSFVSSSYFVDAYMGLGDHEKAIQYLQKGYETRDASVLLQVEPVLNPIRSDPRFQEIVRKMNFPEK